MVVVVVVVVVIVVVDFLDFFMEVNVITFNVQLRDFTF